MGSSDGECALLQAGRLGSGGKAVVMKVNSRSRYVNGKNRFVPRVCENDGGVLRGDLSRGMILQLRRGLPWVRPIENVCVRRSAFGV